MAQNQKKCLFSSLSESEKKALKAEVEKIPGGQFVDSSFYQPSCDYIICKFPSRGEKFLCGSAAGKFLLTTSYVKDSAKARKWLREETYEWCNQATRPGIDEKLLNLPKRCKEIRQNQNNILIFGNWKVLLHVEEKQKRNAYKRLLESGGAKIINLTPPFLGDIKYKVTHVFVTKALKKDLNNLNRDHFESIFYPEYIAEYLIQPIQPPMKKFRLFQNASKTASITNIPSFAKSPSKTKNSPKKGWSPKKGLPKRRPPGQRSIFEMFSKNLKLDTKSDPLEFPSVALNVSTPCVISARNKGGTPLFSEEGVKIEKEEVFDNTLSFNVSPIHNKASDDDQTKINLFPETKKKTESEGLHKKTLLKNAKRVAHDVISLLSDDDDTFISLALPESNSKCKNNSLISSSSTIYVDSSYESNSVVEVFPNDLETSPKEIECSMESKDVPQYDGLETNRNDVLWSPDNSKKSNICAHLSKPESANNENNLKNITSSNRSGLMQESRCLEMSAFDYSTVKEALLPEEINQKVIKNQNKRESIEVCKPLKESNLPLNVSSRGRIQKKKRYSDCVQPSLKRKTLKSTSDSALLNAKRLDGPPYMKKVKVILSPIDKLSQVMRKSCEVSETLKTVETKKQGLLIVDKQKTYDEIPNSMESYLETSHVVKDNVLNYSKCSLEPVTGKEKLKEDGNSKNFMVSDGIYFPIHGLKCFVRTEYRGSKFLKRASFTNRIENMVESCVGEKTFKDGFHVIKDNVSTYYYPTAKTMFLLLSKILVEENLFRATEYLNLLQNISILHPTKDLVDIYNSAFQQPVEEKDGSIINTTTSWEFFADLISDVMDSLELDAAERPKTLRFQMQVLECIVSLCDGEVKEANAMMKKNGNASQKSNFESVRKTLLWQMIWKTSHECTINNYLKNFIHLTFTYFVKAQETKLCQLMLHTLSLVAQLISLKDQIFSKKPYGVCCANLVSFLEIKYEELINCTNILLYTKLDFLSKLRPTWIPCRILDSVLSNLEASFIEPNHVYLMKKPISFIKILYCYLFLTPQKTEDTDNVARQKKTEKQPLKDIKNEIQLKRSNHGTPKFLNRRNMKGESPLQIACIKNNPVKVKELLLLGADPNMTDYAGWSALHEACNYGHVECLNALIQSPDLNLRIVSTDGLTALHDAVRNNHVEIVKVLISKGGLKLLELKTAQQKSVLDFAQTTEMRSILQSYLTNKEANIESARSESCLDKMFAVKNRELFSRNDKKYKHVKEFDPITMEEHLSFLLTLVNSYNVYNVSVEDSCDIATQVKLFEWHIVRLCKNLTFRSKLYVKTISRYLLRHTKQEEHNSSRISSESI